jgi:hypothetical protein
MQCDEVREQIANHVEDSLPPQIADHLATCETCRGEAESLRSVWTMMGAIPTPRPGNDARERFDMMVEAYQQGVAQVSHPPMATRWWQFAAVAAVLVVGVFAGWHLRPSPAPADTHATELAELRGELTGMRQMMALSLMQQQSPSDRLRGVNWSYQLPQPGDEVLAALLDTLIHDPNVNVRLATVDALRQFGDMTVVRKGVVGAMRQQESPIVQMALIGLAVDLKDKDSISTLKELAEDQKLDATVRERAQKGLSELE